MADIKGRTIAATYGKLLYTSTDDGLVGNTGSTTSVVTTDDMDGTSTASCLNLGIDRVGIGTNNPAQLLEVEGSSGGGSLVRIESIDAWDASHAEELLIIDGGAAFPENTNGYFGIKMQDGSNVSKAVGLFATSEATYSNKVGLGIWTYNSSGFAERVRIDGSGKVGIGTSTPDAPLNIEYTTGVMSAQTHGLIVGGDAGSDTAGHSASIFIGTLQGTARGCVIAAENEGGGVDNRHNLVFMTSDSTSVPTEAMRIDHDGNVGIGTDDPSSLLHISSGTSGDATLIIEADTGNSNENDNPQLLFKQDGGLLTASAGITGDAGAVFTNSLENTAYFGIDTDNPLQLYTDSSARLTILGGSGKVGIGTKEPAELLEVEDQSGNCFIQVSSGASSNAGLKLAEAGSLKWSLYNVGATDSPDKLIIQNGTGANGVYLLSNGTGSNSNAWVNNSDERMKENLVEIENATDKLNKLRCVEYNFKHEDASKVRMGLIAQDVYNVYKYAVAGSPSDGEYEYVSSTNEHKNAMGVAYQELITPLIKAIQELSAKVTALENA